MLPKVITYTDYDENERTETFYFNLTRAELTMLESSIPGGLEKMIKSVIAAKDGTKIMEIFEKIIRMSYGVKSPDGKRFIKSEDLTNEFTQTLAYDQLFMELVTDADKASDFVKRLLPKQISEQITDEKINEMKMIPGK